MSILNPRVNKDKKTGKKVYKDKVPKGQREPGKPAETGWDMKGKPIGAKYGLMNDGDGPPGYTPKAGFTLSKAMIKRNEIDKKNWDKLGSTSTGKRRRRVVK